MVEASMVFPSGSQQPKVTCSWHGAETIGSVSRITGRDSGNRHPEPSLSLVIPAYNESARIEATAREAAAWLAAQPFPSQLIVVDDGSEDDTAVIAERVLAENATARVLRIPHGGKAAAVRAGMGEATGDQIAFCDADLATPLVFLSELRAAVARGCDIAIGSREGREARRIGEPFYRHLMGRVFNGLVRIMLLPGVEDTQCGFKLFRRDVAGDLLRSSLLYREVGSQVSGPRVTAFDVELLAIARLRGYRVCSVPVVWTYGAGSKVRPARDTWYNVHDVLNVWIGVKRGRYREAGVGVRK
jgi:glycosyltransferase involved in cell wall biosynthesis